MIRRVLTALRNWRERRKWRVFDPDPRPWDQRVADSRTLPRLDDEDPRR